MISRRQFLATLPFAAATASAGPIGKVKIKDVQVMLMQGDRTYTLVKITADNGVYGIGEAYGSPGIGVKEQILALKPWLIGKDPLQIDALYTGLGAGGKSLSGTRTDGSAHMLMRAASGIEMTLWDLAGKILGVPTSTLLGGRFRDKVRVYDHAAPRDMLDKASCREWAAKVKADPAGFTCHKFGFPRTTAANDAAKDRSNRVLTTKELMQVRQGFENCREAIGWDHDIMVHCHWEYDVRAAIQIAEAVEPIKPVWLEDPLLVDFSSSWQRLTAASKVPICMGENLARREGFQQFVISQGCDILHPDLRNSGGFLETKRIADFAAPFGMPLGTHNTGSQVHTYANINWASSIRDYIATETITGKGDWMDKVLLLDGPYIQGGSIAATEKPGLGIELNPDVVRAHLVPGGSVVGIMLIALLASLMAADTPPTAAEVLDRFTAVTGGEAAYRAVKTQYAESTLTLPQGAGKIRVQMWLTSQGETRSMMTSDGGSEQTGVYRGVAWSLDSGGPKVLTGLKRVAEIHDAVMFPHELWRDTFAKAEYLGSEVLREGESCHKVRLTPKAADLKPETYWFSAKTGLLVKMQNWDVDDEAGGWREMMLWVSDYRKMPNGLLIPHGAEMEVDGMQLKMTFDRMEFDRVFTDRELRYPPAVEKLVRKDAAGMSSLH